MSIRQKPNNFNPRLREGGDLIGFSSSSSISISIHASAKEATKFSSTYLALIEFQSTPPRRRRREYTVTYDNNKTISIHASAKEATRFFCHCSRYGRFQSTPPRRRRPQHIVIPQLSCTYLVSTTFLSAIFSFISQYVVLFFLF